MRGSHQLIQPSSITMIYAPRRFPIFMRRTAPAEPVEPIEPAEPDEPADPIEPAHLFRLQSMG